MNQKLKCYLYILTKKSAITFAIFSIIISAALLNGCTHTAEPVSQVGFYLDTVVQITLYDTGDHESCIKNIQDCFTIIDNYEHLFSATLEGSDIWNINHSDGRGVIVSDDTVSLLQTALYYSEITDGKVDLTVLPLSELWDFGSEGGSHVPDDAAIQEAVSHIDYHTVKLEGNTVTLSDPYAAIDLGFIAKGYIADRLKEYLLEQNVENACISLGGNLITIGNKPDGTPYRIGIQKPFANEGETIATISVTDSSVVSSGIYERYFYKDNKLYHHLLNTQTGYPEDSNIAGVTILAPTSIEADALSTTCYFLGLNDGLKLIESLDGVEALFVTKDGKLHRSDGFSSQ
ncbi:MAG: FAD:protein FMN transferase [Lachnospiraceae bacterium]|nr:FAD:protein FMN transferase [Lachnospiraceae bacterium]